MKLLHRLCDLGMMHGEDYRGDRFKFCPWCGDERSGGEAGGEKLPAPKSPNLEIAEGLRKMADAMDAMLKK